MENNNVLHIENIKKSYGNKTVLDLDSITIKKGEIYGLIGPNGAGKSTLMKIISSLTKADSGNTYIFGNKLNEKNKTNLLKNIGVFIEGAAYYENLTGKENMRIIRDLKQLSNSDIDEAINFVGLQNQMNKKVGKYSLGMKQRLGLAMTLAGLPPFMILDEPTNGLDPIGIKEIRNLIVDLCKNKGITVMISSHILGEIEKMVDHIGIINKGKLLYQGSTDNFKNNFGSQIAFKTSNNEYATDILQDYNAKLNKDCICIKNINDKEIPRIIRLIDSYDIDIYRVYDISKSLEDLFIDLTRKGSL